MPEDNVVPLKHRQTWKREDFHYDTYEHSFAVPEYMRAALDRYINDHAPVGDFLTAILENDYHQAIGRADENNVANLPAYANFLYNHAPHDCHGSKEKVKAWLAKRYEDGKEGD